MGKSKINKLQGRALIVPDSVDAEKRQVEVVFATETPVFRWGWSEDYNEVLVCEDGAVRKDRIKKGLPVLDAHNSYSTFAQIGRTSDVRIENKECRATIAFSRRPELDGIFQDIQDGIIRDISVGYRVYQYERMPIVEGETHPTYRAVDWMPFEISFVPIPADENCGTRGDGDKNEVEVIERQYINSLNKRRMTIKVICPECGHEFETDSAENYTCPECGHEFAAEEGGDEAADAAEEDTSDEDGRSQGGGKKPTGKPAKPEGRSQGKPAGKPTATSVRTGDKPVDVAAIRLQATEQEKTRLNAILLSARAAKLPDSFAIELYLSKKSVEECRQAVIERFAASSTPAPNGNHAANVGKEGIEKKREAVTNAILHRVMPANFKLEQGNDFRGMRMVEMARELLTERGISTRGKSPSEIWAMCRAHSTSDFPILFEDALNKLLRGDYQFAPETWSLIARQTSVSDFRYKNFYQVETENGMQKTPEGGEIKYTTLTQAKQRIKVEKFAQGIKFTREAFINDDLDALSIIPNRFVKDWDELRGDMVYGLVKDNVKMDDGYSLFSASHNNLLTGATSALSKEGLKAALLAFRNQKALGGKRRINVVPRTMIVPIDLEILAKELMTPITAIKSDDVNVFANAYNIISELRLEDEFAWYLMADPNAIDGLYYAYLDGNDGLRVNSEDDFNTDTMKYAVRGEFGVAAVDYRGWVKMAGK